MPPLGVTAALLLLALAPGWAYLNALDRVRPKARRSALSELLEVVAVGTATALPAVLLIVLIPHSLLPFTLDLDQWARNGNDELREDYRGAVSTVAVVFVLAMVVAYGFYRLQKRGRPREYKPEAGVWPQAIGARSKGTLPWVGVRLSDDMLVEGVLHSYSLSDVDGDDRDIALTKPIRVSLADSGPIDRPELDRVVLPARAIKYIVIIERAEAGTSSGKGRRRLGRGWVNFRRRRPTRRPRRALPG